MLGVLLGLFSAVFFGISTVIARRGMLRASSSYIAAISIFTGVPFFLLVTCATGEIYQIVQFPWKAQVFLALSGVIHFALGRTWAYKSIHLIGSTRSIIVTSLNPIISIAMAMIIFKETIKPLMVLGILLALSGPLVTILKEQAVESSFPSKATFRGKGLDRHNIYVGMLYGMGAAVFWGSSTIFIKLGLKNGGSPVAGSLLAYLAASVVISPSLLLNQENKREIFEATRKSFQFALFIGLVTSIAQLLRYVALQYSSVIIVTLLSRTVPLWVLLFSFIYNKDYESFSYWVILGNVLLIVGTALVLIP